MTEPCFLSIAAAARLISARELSPVELTQTYLDRIAALGPSCLRRPRIFPFGTIQEPQA